jgi:lactate dehydrogenase-like 2-hydroxyacid dehydrogenase
LAKAVDFLVVALVGGKETQGAVSREVLEALGPNGVFVNIARGSVVDESALLDMLETGGIAGAGLDVFYNEPKIDPRFLALDNVVLQPHQGSATVETRAAMGQLQRDNVSAFLAGRDLLTPVN